MSRIKRMAEAARRNGLSPMMHENHKLPVTRREMIGQGLLAGFGWVAGPSLLSMLSSGVARAQAASCGPSAGADAAPVNGMRIMAFEAAGGMNIAGSNFMVWGQGGVGDFLPEKALGVLGLPSIQAKSDLISTEFGIAMHANSSLLEGLRAATTPEVRARVTGYPICVTSMDDSTANQFSPVYYLYKGGALGTLAHVIGSEATAHGARSAAPTESIMSSLSATRIQSYDDARNLVSAASLEQLLPNHVSDVLAAAGGLSQSRLTAFNDAQMPSQIRELVRCGYAKSAESARGDLADAVDASKDTTLLAGVAATATNPNTRNFTVTRDPNDGDNQETLSMAYLLLKGYAACATKVMGGRDYHNNPRGSTNQKDFEVGFQMGLAFQAAHTLGKALNVVLYTDGGVGCSNPEAITDQTTQAGGQPMFTGDRGEGGTIIHMVYHPSGRVPIVNARGQVNAFNVNGGVDQNFADGKIVANSVTNAVQCLVLNVLALHGKLGDAETVLGQSHPFRDVLQQYIMLGQYPAA